MASSSKEKAIWTIEDVETFCKLCVEQIEKGNCPATNKRDGWTIIIKKFNDLRGKKYDKTQMRSKWDNLKEEWKRWRTLTLSETGLGWDARKNTVDASDEWWENKIKVNHKLKVFKTKGIPHNLEKLLNRMFLNTVATGGITWTLGQGLCIDENVETTQPDIGDIAGSTNDILECDVGENIADTIGSQTRKRVTQASTGQARGKKEKRLTLAKQLGNQINSLCSVVESRSRDENEGFSPYKDFMLMLDTILEIAQDEKLYFFAIKHFKKKKDNKQVFMSLNSDALRVKYLKLEMGELSDS